MGQSHQVNVASGLPESGLLPEPIVPEVEWNQEAAGSVRTHIVFTIGKHTLTHTIWHPLLLSGRICFLELTAADELHSAESFFIHAHLSQVSQRETQVHSFISPRPNNYKHSEDVHRVLDSLRTPQQQWSGHCWYVNTVRMLDTSTMSSLVATTRALCVDLASNQHVVMCFFPREI